MLGFTVSPYIDTRHTDRTAVYCYEEGADPESFFVPCVWTHTLRASPDIMWFMRLSSVSLIDVYAEGLMERQTTANKPFQGQGSHGALG